MRDRINAAVKEAMREKRAEELSTLRLVNAAITAYLFDQLMPQKTVLQDVVGFAALSIALMLTTMNGMVWEGRPINLMVVQVVDHRGLDENG